MVKTITIRDLKNRGFVHLPEQDFGDDGTNFKIFSYEGMIVSYAKVDGDYFISIRPDYLPFRYEDYKDLPTDNFNGVSDLTVADLDLLVANIKEVNKTLGVYA